MLEYMRKFLSEAATKVTTYVALLVAACSQLAEHAQDLLDTWPDLVRLLPTSAVVDRMSHAATTVLGLIIVWTRVRRILKPGVKP